MDRREYYRYTCMGELMNQLTACTLGCDQIIHQVVLKILKAQIFKFTLNGCLKFIRLLLEQFTNFYLS